MRVERALLEELSEKVFNIGYQGELNHTQVIISCPVMFRDYPDAVASMVVKPPQGDLYPVSLTRDGNDLTWDVSASDVAIPGAGILQLTFTDGEGEEAEIIKTVYGNYSVNASLVANGDAPDPVQSWLDEAGAALATFENEIGDIRKITTATEEDEGLALSPKTVVNGKVTEWEYIDLADPEVVTQAIDDWLDDHPEATTTVEDGAITEAKLNDSLKADLAWQDDVDDVKNAITQPTFVVGNAEEVLSDRGESDEAVYLFRKTGGNAKAYNREQVKKIVGGTVAWNQLVYPQSSSDQTIEGNGVTITVKGDGSLILNGTASSSFWSSTMTGYSSYIPKVDLVGRSGHKILLGWFGNDSVLFDQYGTSGYAYAIASGKTAIITEANQNNLQNLQIHFTSGQSFSNAKIYPMFIDLTAALQSSIADYLYTLETQTAGSGVALFRSLFDKSYYAYNAGSLESVNVSEHRVTGFNQLKGTGTDTDQYVGQYYVNAGTFNVSANQNYRYFKIKCLPNTTYCISWQAASQTEQYRILAFYDGSNTKMGGGYGVTTNKASVFTTPDNCYYFGFSVHNNDASDNWCVNISDSSRNGQYEPYQQFVYAMPNVTLRGIPQLVNGEIQFDGDELTPDGTVTRKYGIVDLGTLTWSYSSGEAVFYATMPSDCVAPQNSAWDGVSLAYPVVRAGYTAFNAMDKVMQYCNYTFSSSGKYVLIRDAAYSDGAVLKTALNGKYLVYVLATPTTETADPYQELQVCSRYGTEEYVDRLATAETSPRDVAIPAGHETFYPVNVFDYIDELTKPDNNFIADANIPSGKYFSVGNGLYLSTSAIAQGETIIPGTNCTAVSLADALNAINQ